MHIPALNNLRVFESVARLGHVGAAAAELHITPGAVSQQLKSLQSALGVELFSRQGRNIVLTQAGLALHRSVAKGMHEINDGLNQIISQSQQAIPTTTLTISTEPVFGSSWLIPSLLGFKEAYPHIRLRIIAANHVTEVDWKRANVALLYAAPPWEGLWWRPLRTLHMFPVCSPQLLRGPNALSNPYDLVHHRLLHEDDGTLWRRWLLEARVPYPGESDLHIESFSMALQAARDGYGVALSDEFNSRRDLDQGLLVRPFNLEVPAGLGYYCLCPEEQRHITGVVQFVDWLIAQTALDVQQLSGRS
ncbi:LysR substrate-binding domain-containing protein [Pseudomonas sp. MT3]|uniref:LysR substrate-binding domain-containing protein n=1 Tax=Pseudomonas TaxID=286 RepID=UPI0002C4DF84|nr:MULTISPECIES: LysR substrate-binding domain-containing protein [unclassified Pseudomonas]AGI22781.1 LysR family transcriptional regulator [Pseudomonas sp. ATCC 13867]QOF82431.1 LysR family transcriptional regulator [Pseudomonas sp. ADPe]GLU42138.1 transcriptional regulator GcvA [Pseudomonas sp. NBRC 100443]